jgi:putative nucleotidyltransferase with HDIG domain
MKIEDLEEKIRDIPTLPLVAHHINIESQRDTFTSKILAGIIKKDPPLSAKLMQLANSAYYGFARQVSSLDRAITLLGFNTVRNIACTVSVSRFFSADTQGDVDMKGLWSHCLGTAVSARILVRETAPHLGEEAFLGGILHDIGTIIIINNFPEMAMKAFRIMREENISQNDAEKQFIGFTHADAGAYLVDKWNFPTRFYRIIRLHHNPPPRLIEPDDEENILLMAVYAGNQLAKILNLGKSLDPSMSGVMPTVWKSLGIEPRKLQELKKEIKNNFEVMAHEWTDGR